MIELNIDWFPFLSQKQMEKLKEFIEKEPKDFMAHQLANILGTDWGKGISVITVLNTKELVDIKLLIYHQCDPGTPVDAYPLNEGFPHLPWYCEDCDTEVENYSELDFDLLAVVKKVEAQ